VLDSCEGAGQLEKPRAQPEETQVTETLCSDDPPDDQSIRASLEWSNSVPNQLLFRELNEQIYFKHNESGGNDT
jgi:hypothetical protein